ncbi:MAG TPA: hypothetical protein VLA99_03465 [Nitrospiraceae bacterium]|nr:hypothetical protein [Nitrospiraceae bacterium]
MTGGGVYAQGPVSLSRSLERQVLALLAIRPRLPFSVLVGLMPGRPRGDLFAALRRLRERGQIVVLPNRRDCDLVRVDPDLKEYGVGSRPADGRELEG